MNQTLNFILAGVGGQGTILASDVLAQVGLEAGYDVKQAEVHGMAQRGGSVSSHVRWGRTVYSPLIAAGEADLLVAFERLEAMRYLRFLRPAGVVLVSTNVVPPITVSAGPAVYPPLDRVRATLEAAAGRVIWLPALEIARELGNDKVANVVTLGALSALVDVEPAIWQQVLENRVPARYLAVNRLAFERGRARIAHSEPPVRAGFEQEVVT